MKYLCLIYLSEQEMDAMAGGLRTKGTFIEAEALPAGQLGIIEVRPTRQLET